MKTRYFKPRTDLEYSCVLRPQKVENGKGAKYEEGCCGLFEWKQHWHGPPDYALLEKNFIEVSTEAEAISRFSH